MFGVGTLRAVRAGEKNQVMMPSNPSGWGQFLAHIRTPLGGTVALIVVAFLALPMMIFGSVGGVLTSIYVVFFMALISVAIVFIIRRTPKGAQGLVATDDFYKLQTLLRHLRIYGDNAAPQTRESVVESVGKIVSDVGGLSPPSQQEPLDTGGDQP